MKESFGGSRAAFDAAQPVAIMRRMAPYKDTTALYCVGAKDPRYGPMLRPLIAASERAGMHTQSTRIAGVAHNWNTGADGFAWGLSRLAILWGLP